MTHQYKLYNGKVILEFEESKHIYSVGGKVIYGTTSIVNVIEKPALRQWAANRAAETVEAFLEPGRKLDELE
ncbi:hypothetical protein LCGC14_3151750, partial [marine sediment metagenome]